MLTRKLAAAGLVIAATLAEPAAASAVPATGAAGRFPPSAFSQLVHEIARAQTIADGRGITVALVSTGVDPSDPSLKGKVTTGPDYAYRPRIPLSSEFGTVAAALIAGSGPTGSKPLTAAGVAPGARILSIRAYPEGNEPGAKAYSGNYDEQNAKGIDYAVSHGAQVIYVSGGENGEPGPDLLAAVQRAVAKKVIIVAAALSDSADQASYQYPSGIPGVIGVGSARLAHGTAPFDNERSGSSNAIFITGPGNSLGDATGEIDGPGAAAAVVAGTVALIKSLYPSMPVSQVELALARSARDRPKRGYDTTEGVGLVDPYGVLQAAAGISRPGATHGVAPGVRLAAGQVPGKIVAANRSGTRIIASAAALAAGLALLFAAFIVARRGRRRAGATAAS